MKHKNFQTIGLLVGALLLSSVMPSQAIVRPDRDIRVGEGQWVVRITQDNGMDNIGRMVGDETHCTGVLVSPRVVLTAAHCVTESDMVSTWRIGIGIESVNATEGIFRRPVAVVYHGKYERSYFMEVDGEDLPVNGGLLEGENDYDADIALVLLDRPVTTIKPIRVPTNSKHRPAKGWRTYGWGITGDEEDSVTDVLLTAAQDDYTAVMRKRTNDPLARVYAAVTVVDGYGSGTCWGDSGGPLVDGRGVLIGLTSYADSDTCSAVEPTLFTRVASFIGWIKGATAVATQAANESVKDGEEPTMPVIAFE
jgi:secreted trypsin-like serine protease